MSRTHVWLWIASCKHLFFLCEIVKILGPKSLGLLPFAQVECQKEICVPSPIVVVVHAENNNLSVSLHGVPRPTQGLSHPVCSCHNHLMQSALTNFVRSRTPNPPRSIERLIGWPIHLALAPSQALIRRPKNFFPLFVQIF